MEDTDDEIDFANLIELFDSTYYEEEDADEASLTLPKVNFLEVKTPITHL